jgi:Kef-type K+ transport system membrane component KefB
MKNIEVLCDKLKIQFNINKLSFFLSLIFLPIYFCCIGVSVDHTP